VPTLFLHFTLGFPQPAALGSRRAAALLYLPAAVLWRFTPDSVREPFASTSR